MFAKAVAFKNGIPLFAALFLVVVFVIFVVPLTKHRIIGTGDIIAHLTTRAFFSEQIRSGVLPLWNPYIAGGTAYFADSGSEFFYPPQLILGFLHDQLLAINLNIILHIWLAGVLMFWFMRRRAFSLFGSLCAAIIYAFSNVIAARVFIGHINYIQTYALVPALFIVGEYFLNATTPFKQLRYGMYFSLVLAALFFIGVIQLLFYGLLLWFGYMVVRLYQQKELLHIRRWGILLCSGIVALLLVTPQMTPTQLTLNESIRSGPLSPEFLLQGSASIQNWKRLIVPNIYGSVLDQSFDEHASGGASYPESALYFGLLPLFLLLFAWANKPRRATTIFLWISAVIILWLSLGKYGGLYKLLIEFPIINRLRIPTRVLMFIPLIGAFGAAIGLEALLNKAFFKKIPNRIAPFAILILLVFDLGVVNYPLLTFYEPKLGKLVKSNDLITLLHDELKNERFRVINLKWQAPVFHIEDLNGEAGFLNKHLVEYVNYLNGIPIEEYEFRGGVGAAGLVVKGNFDSTLVDLYNVKYIVIKDGDDALVTENEGYYPRVLVADNYTVISDKRQALDYLASDGFDAYAQVVLAQEPFGTSTNSGATQPKVAQPQKSATISACSPNTITIHATSTEPAWLVLNDLYYPEWKARINGAETPVYRANYIARAIALPSGAHTIEFFYDSSTIKRGMYISGATLILLLGFIALSYTKERHEKN